MNVAAKNSFGARSSLKVGDAVYEIYKLGALAAAAGGGNVARLPFSLKVLLENLLRNEDGKFVHADDIRALAQWNPSTPVTRKFRSCPRACCCRISPASRL